MDILKNYFYGRLEPQEEAQVQDWLAEHADDPQVVRALDAMMSELEKEEPEISAEAFASVSAKLGIERRKSTRKMIRKAAGWMTRVAVFIMLPLSGALAYSMLVPPQQTEWHEIKVPYGQTDELTLSDGTHLHLNAGSRITYPEEFTGAERRIFVEGEVFADVAKDPERPFIINSGDIDVNVLGTTFNLKAYDNTECVELLLLDGAVRMDIDTKDRTQQLVLHPGEMLQYDRKSGEIDLKEFNPFSFKGFHENGSMHFFNLRLSDIASDLERLFGTKIILLDESLAETRYFAWFTNSETLDQILKGINVDGKMRFRKRDGVIYISRK